MDLGGELTALAPYLNASVSGVPTRPDPDPTSYTSRLKISTTINGIVPHSSVDTHRTTMVVGQRSLAKLQLACK